MRCNLRCKLLLLFIFISAIALSSTLLSRSFIMRDFSRYIDGEAQDRIYRTVALIEGGYDHNSGWQKERLSADLAWALQMGVEARLYDSSGLLLIDTKQALAQLTPMMRKRVLDAADYDPESSSADFVPYPLYLKGEEIGQLDARLLERIKEEYFARTSDRVLLLSASLLGVVSLLAGIIASRRLTRPIHALAEASAGIAGGDLARRVTVKGHDEISRLSKSFNSMAQNLEAQEKLRRTLLSNAAHELRTPLAVISGELEGMIDGVLPVDNAALKSLHDEARRLTNILDGVDELSRAEAGAMRLQREIFPLKPCLSSIVDRFRLVCADKKIVLLLDCTDNHEICADPDRLSQIVINLLTNSIRAVAIGGRITLVAAIDNDKLVIDVTDNGCGITAEDLPHLFERFYKGKNGGLGLGLSIVRELVTAHGGTVSVSSRPDMETRFRVQLPQ